MRLKSFLACALLAPFLATPTVATDAGLTVHEWGTFTSVAGDDGNAEAWVSLTPPADLPCFVYHLSAQCVKCAASKVRMETPVIYFYANQPLTASVHVDLPSGLISEWYPQANQASGGNLEWSGVQVLPGAGEEFPNAGDGSHYYAARATDSAPLRVGVQAEKLLFYRGIADFDIPVHPKFTPDGGVQIQNSAPGSVGFAILFENRGGSVGYQSIHDLRGTLRLDSPAPAADVASVQRELAGALVAAGLYPKEAAAMIETWRDSWFEEGMRLFYIVPRDTVDAVLPLKIAPSPAEIQRVFVGRIEMLSPFMRQTIETALEAGDTATLAKFGRFLRPFCQRLLPLQNGGNVSKKASDFIYGAGHPEARPGNSPCQAQPSALPTEPPQERADAAAHLVR